VKDRSNHSVKPYLKIWSLATAEAKTCRLETLHHVKLDKKGNWVGDKMNLKEIIVPSY
jgi:hypothetical protein